ncbi:hypothetical protein [Pseudoalteromonas distincta]|uniref:hypothetical protein n=1 Tax=Pseudoalteromonas distincta TaxID=77608 RepID=UPI00165FE16F|nr:hypothetical protein [Pseudoalteromonas distincta]MBD0412955.1 hypothetical protein [Pseudoalteromonas distincta]
MTQGKLNNNLTENEVLKQAADLVKKDDFKGAIKLLEHWQKEMPFSLKVLNTLTPLYYKVGDFDRAGKISFKTLSKEPEQEIKSNLGDLPASADLTFLEEQETNLTEAEYSFDDETSVEPVKRKVLSLKLDKTKKSKNKVTIKHKFRRVLKSFKNKLTNKAPAKNIPVNDVITANHAEKDDSLNTSHQLSVLKEVELVRPGLSINKNTEKPPKQRVDVNSSGPANVQPTLKSASNNTPTFNAHTQEDKPKRAVLTLKGKDTSPPADTQQIPKIVIKSQIKDLDYKGASALHEETKRESLSALKEDAVKPLQPDISELQSILQHAKQSATDEMSSQNKEEEQPVKALVFTEAMNTVLLAKSNVNFISDEPSELEGNDLIEDDLEIEGFGDLADFDESVEVEAGSFDTFSDDLYGLWDDSFDDEVEDFTDNGALDNTFTQEDRALAEAAKLITSFDWDRSALPFLTEVLCIKGWVNAKRALEREVAAGATLDELMLAFEVKNLWLDSPRYWIAFSKAYASGESTDAIYRHFSWRQTLRLIRTFTDLPSIEEVYDLLEQEFDYWYDHKILRLCFPAFIKYLFNYRLNERNITSSIGGFGNAQDYDHVDELWASQTHSEEMQKLNEYGVDLLAKNAQPSYYTSDTYTREYLLEYFRSFLPEDEKDKNYE